MISTHLPASHQKPFRWQSIALVTILLTLVIGCESSLPIPAQITTLPPNPITAIPSTSQNLPGWLKVFFTDPNPPDNLGHGIDQFVVPVLDHATLSIDATSLDLNLPSVVNALARANQRGVKVRVVYDGENGNLELDNASTGDQTFDTIETLKASKVSLVNAGRTSGLMHDKIIIVDDKVLFTGSWNLSYNDTYRNNNNLLEITDPRLIANYQAKFDELFINHRFGAQAEVQVPYPTLAIDGALVENYFAPEDGVMSRIILDVQHASKSVHFMAYTYTDHNLARAMIDRMNAGVQVRGVIESRDSDQGAFGDLFCAGVAVKTDGNAYNMHHKVIILDGETVITGSFNFTRSADTINDENVLIIHSAVVAAFYEQEFQRIYAAGETPQSSAFCQN